MNDQRKSPIKVKPLRYSGQSLDEALDKLLNEKAMNYVVVFCLVSVLAIGEWLRYYNNNPPSPKTITALALIVAVVSFYKVREIRKQVRLIRQGRDGERNVGECLDNLREDGHRVFHDLIGDNFNLDHVIVSTKGIFVIETKTYSKPVKGDAKIQYDGEQIIIAEKKATRDPITQVTAASKWLKNILKESTGKDYPVKSVVAFPGWFVETKEPGWKFDTWVLNPKALQSFINNENDKITREDMMLATFHLSQYIRSKAA